MATVKTITIESPAPLSFHPCLLASSLVFSMDETQPQPLSMTPRTASGSPFSFSTQGIKDRVSFFTSSFAEMLFNDIQTSRRDDDPTINLDSVVTAAKLCTMGHDVVLRRALPVTEGGSSSGTHCFRNLRHEFLLVRGSPGSDYEGLEYVVDLRFRDQFEIPHPTPTYQEVLAAVPQVFIGPLSRLQAVVKTLTREMAASFEERGLSIPPWRKFHALLSKWVPAQFKDFPVALPRSPFDFPPSDDDEEGLFFPSRHQAHQLGFLPARATGQPGAATVRAPFPAAGRALSATLGPAHQAAPAVIIQGFSV